MKVRKGIALLNAKSEVEFLIHFVYSVIFLSVFFSLENGIFD